MFQHVYTGFCLFYTCFYTGQHVYTVYTGFTQKVFDATDKEIFVCCKKCEFSKFPFSYVGDKEFIRTNAKTIRFPCIKCIGECNKKYDRLQCIGCSRWLHLECSELPRSEFGKHISSNTGSIYHCSIKCEMKLLPFGSLDDFDFVKYVSQGKLQYVDRTTTKKRKRIPTKTLKEGSPPSSLCEYLDPPISITSLMIPPLLILLYTIAM